VITLVFLIAQIEIEAEAVVNMDYLYPGCNLFFVAPGFANPAISRGLIGFTLNPASMAGNNNSEIMLCTSPTMRTEVHTEFAIPFDSLIEIVDTVRIPTILGVEQMGGFDFLGALFKIKSWRLGIGMQKGDYLGLECSASVMPSASFNIYYADTLTHEDIEGIPVGDSIPVEIELSDTGSILVLGQGSGTYQNNSLCIALSNRLWGLDFGLGWQLTPVQLKGSFDANLSGFMSLSPSLKITPTSDWTIDATFTGEIDADSLLMCQGSGDLQFLLSSLYWGLKKEWRYLSIGLCGDLSIPTLIKGDWQFMTSIPSDLPKFRFDDDSLIVDTLNKIISGKAKLIVYDFATEDTSYQGGGEKPFLGTAGLTGGLSLRIWRFETGFFGGLNTSSDGSYLKMRLGTNLGFRTFIPLRAGLIFHVQYFNIAGIPMTALPVISFGTGTDFNIKRFNIFLNLYGNTTQGAASLFLPGIVEGSANQKAFVAMGLGIRYKF